MGVGFLVVEVSTAKGTIVIGDANVEVYGEMGLLTVMNTNYLGMCQKINLTTMEKEHSLSMEYLLPCRSYSVRVSKKGFQDREVKEVYIFDGETTRVFVHLLPYESLQIEQNSEDAIPVVVSPLYLKRPNLVVIKPPLIPLNVSVHLGVPGSNAKTIIVPFVDYIKNVASSEIYPTWPTEALKANIYAIISLALNRVYTEWYRTKGYNYQITNSTAFDQKYTPNGPIYDSISTIVDSIFNEYIIQEDHIEPLFAAYCDGKTVKNCVGLKQWDTVDLAKTGYNALDILKKYYGDSIEIIESNRIQEVGESYPGRPLQLGSTGNDVYLMKRYLDRIALNYPNIPSLRPANGIFDLRMEAAVKEFQSQFNLPADGRIDKKTWYKIFYIYNGVRKLSEAGQEGERLPEEDFRFRRTLTQGMHGEDVGILQTMLNIVAQFYNTIPSQKINFQFSKSTKDAVVAYQKAFGLKPDGIVGPTTWDSVVKKSQELMNTIPVRDELLQYPGVPQKEGMRGQEIQIMQAYLNEIAYYHPLIPLVSADGEFGPKTKEQVMAFQREFGITPDGTMGAFSWATMLDIYSKMVLVVPFYGFILKEGDNTRFVSIMKLYLNEIASKYPSIPIVEVNDTFDQATTQVIRQFQTQFGLPVTGVVDKATWNKMLDIYLTLSGTTAPPVVPTVKRIS